MPLDADQIAGTLAARGLRLTRQRRAVLDAVADASSSVSPVQVFDAARQHCPELGLTTVYRTLELLSEVGALRRLVADAYAGLHALDGRVGALEPEGGEAGR